MIDNYILKQAVLTAFTMLFTSMASVVFAVGLGDIEVRSHIGQPLKAHIKVQGIEGLKDKDCFRLVDDNDQINQVSRGQLKLVNINGDEAILTIATTEVINEPVVSLSVIAECDSTFRRDYVLLIDPLLTKENERKIDEEIINNVEISNNKIEKTVSQKAKSTKRNRKQTIGINNTSSIKINKNNDSNLIDTPALSVNAEKKTTPLSEPKKNQPRLSISGENFDGSSNRVNLRLDRQLRLSTDTSPQFTAGNAAIEDETTVLSNRLAYLEQQISKLQARNRTLEAEKDGTPLAAQPNTTSTLLESTAKWWPYLGGCILLIGGYFAADYWRRRRQSQQLNNAEEVWSVLDANSNDVLYFKDVNLDETLFEAKPANEADLDNQKNVAQESVDLETIKSVSNSIQIEENVFDNNILDHADVFLAHGRTSLAIQLLQNHLLDYPKESVTIWLFLLDLLAKENLQALYEQTTVECKEHFNIRIVDFSNDEASLKQSLEDFPRLTAGLEQVWGTPAALIYLDDLIYNTRLETRIGFEKSVLQELILLKNIAQNNVNQADIIQMDEKKMAIKELKEAKLAARKAEKLQNIEELSKLETNNLEVKKAEEKEELFEFNLIEFK